MQGVGILFASPHCLLDGSSGAAISLLTLLRHLATRGARVTSLSATIFDADAGRTAAPGPPANHPALTFFEVRRDGIRHLLLPTRHPARSMMNALEAEHFEAQFHAVLQRAPPDVMITYGGLVLERRLLHEARRRGVRTVFYLANPSYREVRTFRDVDLIVTDTAATARLYAARLGIRAAPIGKFIDAASFLAPSRMLRCVTFVNPEPAKGTALVARLALMCREALPDLRFLVVESRGRWAPVVMTLGLDPAALTNVTVVPHQNDMSAVYAQTRVLLVPSFWHESGGRVALEATLNYLPVLFADHGGTAEVLAGAGLALPIPAEVRAKPLELPPVEAAAPWFEALRRIWTDLDYEALLSERARQTAEAYDIDKSVGRFEALLAPLLANARPRPTPSGAVRAEPTDPASAIGPIVHSLRRLVARRPECADRVDAALHRRWFREAFGRWPRLFPPRTFNEWIKHRMLFDRDPRFPIVTDKFAARAYAAQKLGRDLSVPLLAVCERAEDLPWDRLPDAFIVKATHASGWNVVVRDKHREDRAAITRKLAGFLRDSYYDFSREWAYRDIPKRLVVEPLLFEPDTANPSDYKIHTFGGVPRLLQVQGMQPTGRIDDTGNTDQTHGDGARQPFHGRVRWFFDSDLRPLPLRLGRRLIGVGPVPGGADLSALLRVAAVLGAGFDYLRVDFLPGAGQIYLGELTLYNYAGMGKFDPPEWDEWLGALWTAARKGSAIIPGPPFSG